jgi:hypothetical protein
MPASEPAIVVQMPRVVARAGEPANVQREFVLSPSTADTFDQLVELYRRATGTRVSSSHVARAILKGVTHSMESLQREAKRIGPMKLPGNARGREFDRERFEDRLAEAFVAGIRAGSAFHRD